jgi:TP901 family phage tail tape measure protein
MAETEQVQVTFTDDDSAAAIAAKLVSALDSAFARATSKLGDRLEKPFKDMASSAKKTGRDTSKIFADIDESIRRTTRSADAFAKTMGGIRTTAARSGSVLDPAVFDATNRSFNTLDDNIERIIRNFGMLSRSAGGRQVLGDLTSAIRSQANQANVVQQSMTRVAEQQAKARTEAARVAQQRITALEVAASKERIVAAQQEGAQSLAAARASSQQRLAVFRAVVGQIRALERGLGSVLSGGSRLGTSAFGAIGSGFDRLTARARQSSREVNTALNSTNTALERRTSAFRRAFSSQESVVRNSVSNQITQVQRLDSALSTGAVGALAGRSATANALGFGGLAVGGLGLITVLRNGLTAGADFTAGLAVLDAQLQLTDEQLASVRQTALDLGNDIKLPGVSALDAAEAIGTLAKQFGALGTEAAPTAQKAARAVLALSRATGASADDAAQIVGAAVNVFGISADKADTVADKVATALSKAAGTSTQEFAQAFRQGAGVFNLFQGQALGAEGALVEFNAALAILARNGRVGSDAGTSLKTFFLQGTRQAEEATSASRELAASVGETGNLFFTQEGEARRLSETVDILRRSTANMTEEQRDAALGILFGTDAIATANALIQTSAEEYDNLVKSLERQGTAAELAAARNQGLRGAMDALGSTIETQLILAYEKVNIAAGNVVVTFAELANSLFSGEGAWAVVRTGLKGVAAGLGALLAVKVVAEGFGLLRLALAGLLTPMGLFIAGAAVLGGAFALLMEHSEGFRAAVDEARAGFTAMVDAFKANDGVSNAEGFVGVMERIGIAARTAFNYVGDVVIPKIAELASAFGNFVVGRARDFASFFGDEVIPRVVEFAGMLRDVVLPRLEAFVNFVTDEVVPAVRQGLSNAFDQLSDAISSFWAVAGPVLEPAATGLRNIATALRELIESNPQAFFNTLGAGLAGALGGFAVAGPIGAVVGGLGAATGALFLQGFGDEIVGGLQTVGDLIVSGLQTALSGIGGALSRIFSVNNLIDFGLFATEMAQRLGRVIGNIVSDPRLVAGVAGFAGFAALAAARFVLGFGQGILSNVPELASMLGDALQAALKAAISSVASLDAGDLALALAAVFIGGAALRAFRSAGQRAGAEVQTGFLTAFRQGSFGGALAGGGSGVRGGAAGSFFTGLLGGPDALARAITLQGARANSAALRVTQTLNNTLALAGRRVAPREGGIADAVRSQYNQLINEVGPSGVLGLKLRAGMQAGLNSLRSLSTAPFRQFLNDMGVQGFQLAKQVGAKVAAGLAGGVAGFQVGKSLATAGIGEQALGIGGTALAIGAINPVAGAAAGALGVLGVAMGKVQAAAAKSKAEVLEYTDALSGIAEADIGDAGLSVFLANLKDESTGVVDLLADLDFNAREFVEGISSGATTPVKTFTTLLAGLGDVGRDVADFLSKEGITSAKEFEEALRGTGEGVALRNRLEDIGVSANDIVDVFDLLTDESGELREALDRAGDTNAISGFDALRGSAERTVPALDSLVGSLRLIGLMEGLRVAQEIQESETAARDAAQALEDARTAADRFLNGSYGDSLQGSIDDLIVNLPSIESQLSGLADLPAAVQEATRRQLGDSIQMDLRAAIRVGLETGEITNPGQYLTDLRTMIQALIDTGQIPANAGAAVIAQIDSLTGSPTFNADMATLMQSLVDNGVPPVVPAPFTLDPQVTISEEAKGRIGNDIAAALGSLNSGGGQFGMSRGLNGRSQGKLGVDLELDPQITLAAGAEVAAAAAGLGLARAVAGGFTSGGGQIATAATSAVSLAILSTLSALGSANAAGAALARSFAAGINAGRGAAIAAAVALGAAASAAVRTNASAAFSAGVQIAQGLAGGIRAGTGAAVGAAQAMASAVAAASRVALKIKSPSQVFADIGYQIGAGLAQGIADSEGAIAGAARSAVDSVIKATTERADEIAAASAQLFGLLRPGGANGISDTSITRQRLGLANLATDLQEVFDNSARTLLEAVVATNQGTGNALQRNINHQYAYFGQNYGAGSQASLDPNFVLGQMNVSALLDAGEKIREFIETSVEAGGDINSVIAEAQRYREMLTGTAAQYNANADQVNALLDQLGISDGALNTFRQQVAALNEQANQVRQPTPDAREEERAREEAERAREEAERARVEAEKAAQQAEIDRLKEELRRQGIDSRPIDIHVAVPYGDPEAIGLGVVNRLAFELGR